MIIAIDGLAGSGKSSTAKIVAEKLGYNYFTTGKMYRAFTLFSIENDLVHDMPISIEKIINDIDITLDGKNFNTVFINGINYTKKGFNLYSNSVNKYISRLSSIELLREKMVKIQRSVSEKTNIVCEGRDIGTVVFPNADLKFFFKADLESRVNRRYVDLKSNDSKITKSYLRKMIKERDYKDMHRTVSPLKRAKDSFLVITTNMTMEEQINFILKKIKNTKEQNDKNRRK